VMVLARILDVHPQEMIDKFTMSMAYQSN